MWGHVWKLLFYKILISAGLFLAYLGIKAANSVPAIILFQVVLGIIGLVVIFVGLEGLIRDSIKLYRHLRKIRK